MSVVKVPRQAEVSTLLTLFVVPGGYVVMHRGGDRVKEWVTGKKVREEMPEAAPAAGD